MQAHSRPRSLRSSVLLMCVMTIMAVPCFAADMQGDDEIYPVKYITAGAPASSEQGCASLPNAVWVSTQWVRKGLLGDSSEDIHECIRYFPSDNAVGADSAIIFFSGDIVPVPGRGDETNNPGYPRNSYRKQIDYANAIARSVGLPFIHVARPGMYGSSGQTNYYRHSIKEAVTLNAAVDAIKRLLGYRRISVIGQSGGGGVVAALLTSGRTDLDCVTLSSATASIRTRLRTTPAFAWVRPGQDTTGLPLNQVYDARERLDGVQPDTHRRVFMLADPEDKQVSFFSQKEFAEAANAKGIPIRFMPTHGVGAAHHNTQVAGIEITALCMRGRSDEDIVERAGRDLEGL